MFLAVENLVYRFINPWSHQPIEVNQMLSLGLSNLYQLICSGGVPEIGAVLVHTRQIRPIRLVHMGGGRNSGLGMRGRPMWIGFGGSGITFSFSRFRVWRLGYRGTLLIRKRTPLGPYRRPMPRVLMGS